MLTYYVCVGCYDVALVTSVWESINLVWTSSVYIRLNVCLFVPLFNHFVKCLYHPQVGETLIYDPILVEEELLVAEKLGFSRIQQNEVCLKKEKSTHMLRAPIIVDCTE